MIRITDKDLQVYDTPKVQLIEICPEQCFASSCSLDDMDENELYDDLGF